MELSPEEKILSLKSIMCHAKSLSQVGAHQAPLSMEFFPTQGLNPRLFIGRPVLTTSVIWEAKVYCLLVKNTSCILHQKENTLFVKSSLKILSKIGL